MLDLAVSPHCSPIDSFRRAAFALASDRAAHEGARTETPNREAAPEEYQEPDTPAPPLQGLAFTDSLLNSEARRWIAQVQAGDQRGLNQLHIAFSRKVFASAMSIVRREEIADEVVSSCFMQVWKGAARYDPARGPVVAWLMRIAKSRSCDALRRANVAWHREVGAQDSDPLSTYSPEFESEPGARLERKVRGRRVQRALLRLSPMQRQVLSLTTLDGMSQDEASQHLQLPLGTVKSHARRGLAALRHRCDSIGLSRD